MAPFSEWFFSHISLMWKENNKNIVAAYFHTFETFSLFGKISFVIGFTLIIILIIYILNKLIMKLIGLKNKHYYKIDTCINCKESFYITKKQYLNGWYCPTRNCNYFNRPNLKKKNNIFTKTLLFTILLKFSFFGILLLHSIQLLFLFTDRTEFSIEFNEYSNLERNLILFNYFFIFIGSISCIYLEQGLGYSIIELILIYISSLNNLLFVKYKWICFLISIILTFIKITRMDFNNGASNNNNRNLINNNKLIVGNNRRMLMNNDNRRLRNNRILTEEKSRIVGNEDVVVENDLRNGLENELQENNEYFDDRIENESTTMISQLSLHDEIDNIIREEEDFVLKEPTFSFQEAVRRLSALSIHSPKRKATNNDATQELENDIEMKDAQQGNDEIVHNQETQQTPEKQIPIEVSIPSQEKTTRDIVDQSYVGNPLNNTLASKENLPKNSSIPTNTFKRMVWAITIFAFSTLITFSLFNYYHTVMTDSPLQVVLKNN